MEQLEFFTVPSPCVGVCTIDEEGYCRGCMRKREERFNWLSMTPAQQLHVIKLCRQRYMRKMRSRGQTQDLFDKVKEHLDSSNSQLDFSIRHEIEVKVFQQNDLDSLSDKAIRALFKILEIIVLPFILSCLATIYMEQSDKIRTVFQGLTSAKEVKHEIRNNTFDHSFTNYRIVIATELNLREHPTTKSAVMGRLPLGEVLETLDAEDRHWIYVRVELDGEIVTGWVYRRYTKRLKTHGSAR
ncbi:TPA: DUF1289 domain-containing protein [Vibrio parahaemolyticus]|nr:DUF1289 domain-containing protein [Vibrio parahaemolyticus]EIZ1363751.1 DUF1289 domain-containing protein [Vibrio vulnificus]EGR1326836.1 DUF1289 domain-containing protein [Vibrio parahaemolyticus]EGR1485544.1 DUF1289 domain-containing protein [Vibrio parahaemolyticus]EGR2005897.1 DUF1289 domain-containing protein [Vibrio parahaemolyticus]